MNQLDTDDLELAVCRTGEALQNLNGAELLLSGGTGFFGRWLLATLIHANRTRRLRANIYVITRSPQAFRSACPELANDAAVKLVHGDVRSVALDGLRFTHVIHAATDTSLAADAKPLDLVDTIVSGTRHILQIAIACGAADFLYISSGAVYGSQGDLIAVSEAYTGACDPTDRRSAYAEAKRMGEMLSTLYGLEHGLRVRIARCFAFVGPGMPLDAHFAIANFIRDAIAGRVIEIKGDGTPVRSYLYAGDTAAWLLRALTIGRPAAAYNIGSDHAVSLTEIAELVANVIPNSRGFKVCGSPAQFRSRYVPAIDVARRDLGVDVWTPLSHAITQTATWAKRK